MSPHPVDGPTGLTRWCLESLVAGASQLRRVTLHPLPFRVGRAGAVGLPLGVDSVSKRHAELFERGGALWVRDLGSRNGTFVNGERVGEKPLDEGDILHFADVEFRVARERLAAGPANDGARAKDGVARGPGAPPAVRGRRARAAGAAARAAGHGAVPAAW